MLQFLGSQRVVHNLVRYAKCTSVPKRKKKNLKEGNKIQTLNNMILKCPTPKGNLLDIQSTIILHTLMNKRTSVMFS